MEGNASVEVRSEIVEVISALSALSCTLSFFFDSIVQSPSTSDAQDDGIKTNTTINDDYDEKNFNKNSTNETSQQQEEQKQPERDYDEVSEDEENDVENIQDERDQGYLEEQFGFNQTSINPFEEPTLKGGHIAAIFGSTLILLSLIAYIGLGNNKIFFLSTQK